MQSTEKCSGDGCERVPIKRGMCGKHYQRWRKSTPAGERTPTIHRSDTPTRFAAKVNRGSQTSCWEWTGSKDPLGYGTFRAHGKNVKSHRYALEASGAVKPSHDSWALHRCDNSSCVNPRHLYWGTRAQNVDDAWARGRYPVSDERPAAKLTNAEVVDIRTLYAGGVAGKDLALKFGVANCTIYQITSGTKWQAVGGPITRRHKVGRKKTKENQNGE